MMDKMIKTGPQFRAATFDKATINEDDRTVELAFSSETPVRRWYGEEILDHQPGSVRMDRINNGAAVLVDHDTRDQVGVVVEGSATIGADKMGRARVRFGKSTRASEIFQDVIDEIRTKISIAYITHRMVLIEENDNVDVYRVDDWEPYEISFVSVPADDSVGVGRNMVTEQYAREFGVHVNHETRVVNLSTNEESQMERNEGREKGTNGNDPVVNVELIQAETRETERNRVDGIVEISNKYGLQDMARDAIQKGTDLVTYREMVLDRVEAGMKATVGTGETIPTGEMRKYSLMNAIRAQASGDWSKAGFEREVSIACMERMGGKDPRGFYVPFEALGGKRAQSVGTANKGGDLVATELMEAQFIELLRASSLSGVLGVRYLPGLVGNIDIPKMTAGGTFGWVAEDVASGATDVTVGKVSLSPETITGSVYMTRRTLLQTTPAIESLVRDDIIKGMGLALDQAIFEGSGAANQPLGVANQSGINTQTIAANATTGFPTFAELVGFETAVETDNALASLMSFVTTPAIYGGMRTTTVDSGSGQFITDKIGYEIYRSNQLDAQRILFGDFSQVLVGLWGALDINVDVATDAAKGGLWLRAFQDADVAVRHPESFCKNSLPA